MANQSDIFNLDGNQKLRPEYLKGDTFNPTVDVKRAPPQHVEFVTEPGSLVHPGSSKTSPMKTEDLYVSGHKIPATHLCPHQGDGLKLLILITSALEHSLKRSAIRLTWGHYTLRSDVTMAFVVGLESQMHSESLLAKESNLYRDIIQGNFVDVYDNLTLKTISMMEWIHEYCPSVRFVLKTDDDMFINVPKLLEFISAHGDAQRTFYGRLAHNWRPFRDANSKYYLSRVAYPEATLPDFTTGPAYLFTSDVVRDIYTRALATTYVKLEDVFITGIVAQALNINRQNVVGFFNIKIEKNTCAKIKTGVSIHQVEFSEQFDLWKKLLDGRSECT